MISWFRETCLEKHYKLIFTLILLVAGFNIFFKLGGGKIYDWDEARHGANAYEMIKYNNYFNLSLMAKADYNNTKPVLGFWLIAASYKIFGNNYFSLRFPNALATLLCIGITMLFAKKLYGTRVSIFTGLILMTFYDFIFKHSGRQGGFDAQLALLVLLAVICMSKVKTNIKYFYLSSFIISLAFLLKSFAAFQIFFIMGAFFLATKYWSKIKFRHYLVFAIIFLVPILLWMFARYQQDGMKYFNRMIEYDIMQRAFETCEGHEGSIFYHLFGLSHRILPWSFFFYAFFFYKNKITVDKNKRFPLQIESNDFFKDKLLVFSIFIPLIIFSLVKTKLGWYIVPIYPPLAIMLAWYFNDLMEGSEPKKTKRWQIVFIVLFLLAEVRVIGGIYQDQTIDKEQQLLLSLNSTVKGSTIYRDHWTQSGIFITEVVKGQNPVEISSLNEFSEKASSGDMLLLENNVENREFYQKYNYPVLAMNEEWVIVKK
jgi:4-amino-4-deoxy-L-arabinose transferase-like glycosyltransferase